MTDKERIRKVLKFSKMSATKFAKAINVGQSSLAVVLDLEKTNKPGMSIIRGIMDYYPNINPIWLIKGEGEMWMDEKVNCEEIERKYLEEKEKSHTIKQNRELVFKLMSRDYPDIMKEFEEYF